MMNYERVLASLAHACAEAGKKISQQCAMAGDIQPLYLYFKKSTSTETGDLLLVPDSSKPPADYELATGEGLRGNIPYDSYYTWVRERATRLPVLPFLG